jgi:DNA-binding IclR family transcriptional regulator
LPSSHILEYRFRLVGRSISGVGVLDKTMLILAVLAGGEPSSLGEVADATGLPRATAHRLLHALAVHGVTAYADDERWSLGPRLVELAAAAPGPSKPSLSEIAWPVLAELRDETGESVQLYLPRAGLRVCTVSLESPHSLRTIVPVGAELPIDRGSAGKVLAEDGSAGRRGWVQSVEEREKGVASVSAPVRRDGSVVAAVSVSGPVERTTRSPGRKYATAVVAAARRVEEAMGWR